MHKYTLAFLLGLLPLTSHAQMLCRNEETIFTFKTTNNKKVLLAEDTDGSYMVYRFGTDDKVEFEFPEPKDSTSFRKFAYSGVIRGQSPSGEDALDLNFLAFYNKGYQYIIYDLSYNNTDNSVGIKVVDTAKGKTVRLPGIYSSRKGDLSFRWNDRVTQSDIMYED